MDIYRAGRMPETARHWAEVLSVGGLPMGSLGIDALMLVVGLAFAAAALRSQAPMVRGLIGEWTVRCRLRRHRVQAAHDLLLPRADGKGWTQIDHLARLPDRILILETKNLGGALVGREDDATWYQRFGRRSYPFLNPLWQNALHVDTVRALVGSGVRVEGMVLMVGRGWFDGRLPDGCYRLSAFDERLRTLHARGVFANPTQDRLDTAWQAILAAASRRLRDFHDHGRSVERSQGRRRRAPAGLAYAIGAGVLLGLYLAP